MQHIDTWYACSMFECSNVDTICIPSYAYRHIHMQTRNQVLTLSSSLRCVALHLQVLSQFRNMYETRNNMEEVYVMGHRLIVFLNQALPQHPEYLSTHPEISFWRQKNRQELDWIQNRLDVVALRVDEEQLNQYILNDLRGYNQYQCNSQHQHQCNEKDRDDQSVSPPQRGNYVHVEAHVEAQWESFSGWTTAATDQDFKWEEAHDVSFESSEMDASEEQDSYDDDDPETYQTQTDFLGEESDLPKTVTSMLEEEDYTFLHRIAEEELVYDTDSEAVDSWAQTSDDGSPSPRLSHRKAFTDLVTNALKRPVRQAEDPPGISLSKINCFMAFRTSDDRLKDQYDKENETCSTAPSDEEQDLSPRWRVRFNEGRNRFQAYDPEATDNLGALSIR